MRELTVEEADEVAGGVAPLVVAAVAVGGFALGVAAAFAIGALVDQAFE